jgi:hypothetical protein
VVVVGVDPECNADFLLLWWFVVFIIVLVRFFVKAVVVDVLCRLCWEIRCAGVASWSADATSHVLKSDLVTTFRMRRTLPRRIKQQKHT